MPTHPAFGRVDSSRWGTWGGEQREARWGSAGLADSAPSWLSPAASATHRP